MQIFGVELLDRLGAEVEREVVVTGQARQEQLTVCSVRSVVSSTETVKLL